MKKQKIYRLAKSNKKHNIRRKNYIYTNGTYGHGQKVKSALLLDKEISKVFSQQKTLPYI